MSVVATLEALGVDGVLRGDEFTAPCPAHRDRTGKPDNNPSWSLNVSKRVFNCLGCGWSGTYSALLSYLGGDSAEEPVSRGELAVWKERLDSLLSGRYIRSVPDGSIPESSLGVFVEPPVEAMESRRIGVSSCRELGIVWDHRSTSWIIPIRLPSGLLLGWQVKGHGEGNRTFRNFPQGVRKGRSLFGLDSAAQSSWVMVVESPLDVAVLAECGFPAVATYGASISEEQANMLRGFDDVVSAFDADEAGRRAEAALSARGFPSLWGIDYPEGAKDPGDMTRAQTQAALGNRYSVLKRRVESLCSRGS